MSGIRRSSKPMSRAQARSAARGLAEQTTTSEEIAKTAVGLHTMIAATAQTISSQAANISQISAAADGMSAQAEQVLRGAADQARAMRGMTADVQNAAKQIKLITTANIEHSTTAAVLLASIAEIRQITDRNAAGVKQTRGGTDDLRRRAQALAALVERSATSPRKTNGRVTRSGR